MPIPDIQQQNAEWKRKGWSIPELRGGKQEWFLLVVELVQLIGNSSVGDLSFCPNVSAVKRTYPWRVYMPFLKGVGLVSNRSGMFNLTEMGVAFCQSPSKKRLASLLHDNYRLFGEILESLRLLPKTVEEVDKEFCREYCLNWTNLSNTRRRMDWLEVLGLIQGIGNRKWSLAQDGLNLLGEWLLVTPDVVGSVVTEADEITIAPPPAEIFELLQALKDNPLQHNKRNTYNVWVPSPNRIENLRTIVRFSFEKVSRTDLFKFIEEEFRLKASSVESMMPFLRADGLLEEVGRNIYMATAAAKAWCESGNDLDFIRILHVHKRFVGELIITAEKVSARNDIYAQAKKYGLNTEKTRWMIGFLLEAGLLEETQYLHIKATPLGMKFASELPLAKNTPEEPPENSMVSASEKRNSSSELPAIKANGLYAALRTAARDPMADGKASGVAFEESIASIFCSMGFDAKRIGGGGDTDVIVRWKDDEGQAVIAIVDGKSKSSGTVAHSDVSDVAIETHKEKNNADFVAIVGPGFSGDTIKNHARKKGFALITDTQLIDIAESSKIVGLSLTEIALLFKVPNGLSQLDELIATRKREMEIITLVISTFKQEQEAMDSLSARDLYFLLRRTSVSPSLEDLLNAFETLSKEEIGVLLQVKKAPSLENATYSIDGEYRSVNRLRALASAIEKGLEEP